MTSSGAASGPNLDPRYGDQQTHKCGDAHSLTAQPLMAPQGVNPSYDIRRLNTLSLNTVRLDKSQPILSGWGPAPSCEKRSWVW
jgi:hypothetical protein